MFIKMKCNGKIWKEMTLIELQDIEKLGTFCFGGSAIIFILSLFSGVRPLLGGRQMQWRGRGL